MAIQSFLQLKQFKWKGIDSKGHKKTGQIVAHHRSDAIVKINKQGVRITNIREYSSTRGYKLTSQIKHKEITLFTRQISTLLSSGLPLIQSLKLVSNNQTNQYFQLILLNIIHDLESGLSLSQSMKRSESYFDDSYIHLIASGELTGQLDTVFERLANLREKKEKLRSKIIKAMIYPSLVLFVALIVSLLMLLVVIPELESLFFSFGAQLPWFTQKTIQLSYELKNHSMHIVLMLVISGLLITFMERRSKSTRLIFSHWRLKIPIFGSIYTIAVLATFSHSLAENLASGIPILKGLSISAKTMNNLYYQQVIDSVCHTTSSGIPLHIAIKNSHAFPDYFTQMVMIGEESGSLDTSLKRIATHYENEVDNRVDNLNKSLEPLIIIILGLLVGGLVTSMYLPIFNLMSVMG